MLFRISLYGQQAAVSSALFLMFVLGGCSGAQSAANPDSEAKRGEPMNATVIASTPYTVVSVGKVDVEGGLIDVAARAEGIVKEVMVQEGDTVSKGQVLARQDDREARLSRDLAAALLRQTEAQIPILEIQLAAAQRELSRLRPLLVEQAVSQQAYDQATDRVDQLAAQVGAAQSSVALARADFAQADYKLELFVVRAPTSGHIVRRYANPGSGSSTLSVTAMFQLQSDADRIVRAGVEEPSLSKVEIGQEVEIVPEADQEKIYSGSVKRIAGVMGARKLSYDDPGERPDQKVVEVVIDASNADVVVGQRVIVRFLKAQTG